MRSRRATRSPRRRTRRPHSRSSTGGRCSTSRGTGARSRAPRRPARARAPSFHRPLPQRVSGLRRYPCEVRRQPGPDRRPPVPGAPLRPLPVAAADVVAPPYDVIDEAHRQELLEPQPVQRRAPDPAGPGTRPRPARSRRRWLERRHPDARAAALGLVARAGGHRPRRCAPQPLGAITTVASTPTARAPCARTSARSTAEGRPARPDARRRRQPLAHLRDLRRPCARRARCLVDALLVDSPPLLEIRDPEGTEHRLWRIDDAECSPPSPARWPTSPLRDRRCTIATRRP